MLLPCGCVMTTEEIDGVRAFVVWPCSLGCEYYRFVVEETARQQKPFRAMVG